MNTSAQQLLSLLRFGHEVTKRMDANLSIHGISLSEYQVLHQLACSVSGSMPRVELARLVGLTPSGVTRLLGPMEKIGLVAKETHPRDARLSLVKLTEAGTTKYQDTTTTVGHVADSFLGGLNEGQRSALDSIG